MVRNRERARVRPGADASLDNDNHNNHTNLRSVSARCVPGTLDRAWIPYLPIILILQKEKLQLGEKSYSEWVVEPDLEPKPICT